MFDGFRNNDSSVQTLDNPYLAPVLFNRFEIAAEPNCGAVTPDSDPSKLPNGVRLELTIKTRRIFLSLFVDKIFFFIFVCQIESRKTLSFGWRVAESSIASNYPLKLFLVKTEIDENFK